MKYVLVHFGQEGKRIYVEGFIAPNGMDDDILFNIEQDLIKRIEATKDSEYPTNHINAKEMLYSIQHPNEINSRGDKLVNIRTIDKPVKAGYWLEEIDSGEHIVNLK